MTNELLQQLRAAIDDKHRRAIEALDTIGTYLDEVPKSSNGLGSHIERHGRLAEKLLANQAASIRARVLESIRGPSYATIDAILADHPTLNKRQVWGVITAPDLKDRIERTTGHAGTAYRLKPQEE